MALSEKNARAGNEPDALKWFRAAERRYPREQSKNKARQAIARFKWMGEPNRSTGSRKWRVSGTLRPNSRATHPVIIALRALLLLGRRHECAGP